MIKLNKWVAKNKALAMVLFCVIEIVGYSLLFYVLHFPLGFIIAFDLLLICYNHMFVNSCHNFILKKPMEEMSKRGDPAPLFYATQELLTYKHSESNRQMLLIDYCVALREMGELQQAYGILTSINIDKSPGTLPITKALYYNNLSDVCDLLGDPVQADVWYSKMIQIYNDMPENRFKKTFRNTACAATADHCFRKEDYEQAAFWLDQIHTDDLPLKVGVALLYAKIGLKRHDVEAAKQPLHYVAENGNKLYAVALAQNLLRQIAETTGEGVVSQ